LSFKPPPQRCFSDIKNAIAMIEQFTSGMDFEAFRSNPMAVAAVERKLQIISEAATRLGMEAERLCPDSAVAGHQGHWKPASSCLRAC
jgi:uncharacterized protein with HEPN domain